MKEMKETERDGKSQNILSSIILNQQTIQRELTTGFSDQKLGVQENLNGESGSPHQEMATKNWVLGVETGRNGD